MAALEILVLSVKVRILVGMLTVQVVGLVWYDLGMPKRQPPRTPKAPEPDERHKAYFEAKLVVFEFESAQALEWRDWKRLRALFHDFGQFIQRYPAAVNGKKSPLQEQRRTG